MNREFSSQVEDEMPHVWRFALRLSGSTEDAEELLQKTMLRALQKRSQYKSSTHLRSWLFSISHSIWKNDLRAKSIRKNVDFNTPKIEQALGTTNDAETNQLFQQVIHRVNELPEAQRTVMILVAIQGFSYQETSDILELPIGTVMSRLARARITIGQKFLRNDPASTANVSRIRERGDL